MPPTGQAPPNKEPEWGTPVQFVRGVGPKRAESLNGEGVHTAGDLLMAAPFRYEDRSSFLKIRQLEDGRYASVLGRVILAGTRTTPRKGMKLFELVVRDESGALNVVFFNQPFLKDVFKEGKDVVLFGKVERDPYSVGGRFQMKNPAFELVDEEEPAEDAIHTGRVVPVYRKLGGMATKQLRSIQFALLRSVARAPEVLPPEIVAKYGFLDRLEALRRIHFPHLESEDAAERASFMRLLDAGDTPAHQRMIYEEFFLLQAGLQFVSGERRMVAKPHRYEITEALRDVVRRTLPFRPTSAQRRVIKEIVDDLLSPAPMHRLLQGDVGSGKTIVAVQAVVVAVENGLQAALMAPTEILAEQHFNHFSALLAHAGYRIALMKSGTPASEKERFREGIASGEFQVVVGTHSVIQKDVTFHRLGLAIVDEQHRFGVLQRAELMSKGSSPDILVMTATPIPRTLALTVYGDLSLSVIDEMPPGRRPPSTVLVRGDRELPRAYERVRGELKAGRQAFVVYPLIEESEKMDLRHAEEGFVHLSQRVFPEFSVGLLHGRMAEAEKNRSMADFRDGKTRVLVSTTVVEVGIDIPNATVMLVENAERFGLSQLHQLRGRIGRGGTESLCLLVAHDVKSEDARRRLEVMCRTSDGFQVAEEDMAIRGPGEVAGTRQSGLLQFRFGSLTRHREAMERARRDASDYVSRAIGQPLGPEMAFIKRLQGDWASRFGLSRIG